MAEQVVVSSCWNVGDTVCLRHVLPGRVASALPTRVVRDEAYLLALYLCPGTRCRRRSGIRGGPQGRSMLVDSGCHEEWIWLDNRRLLLWKPGDAHTASLFWRGSDGVFLGWYVDLLDPLQRTPVGFDTRDRELDIWIRPDRSWMWKDEDELAWSVETGALTSDHAEEIRKEGLRALDRLNADDDVFAEKWTLWKPPASWTIPILPPGWDDVGEIIGE